MSSFGSKGRKSSSEVASQSSNSLLGADGIFFGSEFTEILGVSDISVNVFTDVDSIVDGLSIEWSTDGVNVDDSDEYTINANNGQQYTLGASHKFFRIRYTNGPNPQTEFRLQTIISPTRRKPSSHRISNNLSPESDAELVKAIIAGEDEFKIYRNILTTRFGRGTQAIFDSQTDSPLLVTPSGQLNTGELVRLVGGNFIGGQPLLPHIWTENFVNSGNIVIVDGELDLNTGTTANSVTRITTFRRARFITATFNLAHLSVATPSFQNPDVIRRWGVYDPISTSLGTDGVFFENDSGNFSIVRIKNGIEQERIAELNWNAKNPLIKSNNLSVYEIFYNSGTIFFSQNRKLLHKMTSLDSAAYNSPHLRAGAIVENINGNTTDNSLVSRGFAISRIGANSAIPEPFVIASAGTFIIKNTPARLHRIIITDKGTGASSIVVYNNFVASGEIVAAIDIADVVGELPFGVELDMGLTIETFGNQVNLTVVFD